MTASGGSGHIRADMGAVLSPEGQSPVYSERIALVDLLDRVLAGGVVLAGDVTLSIAGVDMVRVSLRALVASVSALASSSGGVLEPTE
jgi:gas vesicle protein GvpA/GvpJ/GvpM family